METPKVSEYWQERERLANALADQDIDAYNSQVRDILQSELKEIQKEIEAFYQHYATRNHLTLADAKASADKLDIAHYNQLAAQYVKDKDTSKEANEQMALYNLRLKTSRLKYIQACINYQIVKHSDMVNKTTQEALYQGAMKEYERQAGIFGMDVPDLPDRVQQLVDGSFHGASWDSRIWKHQKALRKDLFKILQTALIQGKNPRDFVDQLAGRFDVTKSDAERLLRTEYARVQVGAQLDSIKQSGATEVVFIDAEDKNVCPICAGLDGRHFKISDLAVGVNQPPIHPNCRCSLGAYYGDDTFDKLMEYAKDPNADNMTFEQWMAQKDKPVDWSGISKRATELLSSPDLNSMRAAEMFSQAQLDQIYKEYGQEHGPLAWNFFQKDGQTKLFVTDLKEKELFLKQLLKLLPKPAQKSDLVLTQLKDMLATDPAGWSDIRDLPKEDYIYVNEYLKDHKDADYRRVSPLMKKIDLKGLDDQARRALIQKVYDILAEHEKNDSFSLADMIKGHFKKPSDILNTVDKTPLKPIYDQAYRNSPEIYMPLQFPYPTKEDIEADDAFYSPKYNALAISNNAKDYPGESLKSIIYHELGHYTDKHGSFEGLSHDELNDMQKSKLGIFGPVGSNEVSNSDQFLAAVRQDRADLMKQGMEKVVDEFKKYVPNVRDPQAGGVEDFLDGIFGTRDNQYFRPDYYLPYGHGSGYYNRAYTDAIDNSRKLRLGPFVSKFKAYMKQLGKSKPNILKDAKEESRVYETASEMFGNLSQSLAMGSEQSWTDANGQKMTGLELWQKFAPHSLAEFEKIIKNFRGFR